jgi:hypothetical protein
MPLRLKPLLFWQFGDSWTHQSVGQQRPAFVPLSLGAWFTPRTHRVAQPRASCFDQCGLYIVGYGTEAALPPDETEQLPDLEGYLKIASEPVWLRVRIVAIAR